MTTAAKTESPSPPGASLPEDVLIDARHVSKKFCRNLQRALWYGVRDIAREMVGLRAQDVSLRDDEFWALRDISFELKRGESLGILGQNGAGKSTLLKLLIGRLKPTEGRIGTRGRMAAITELGLGFNPVLSGRENIYLNAAMLGMQRAETNRVIDKIIEFAGIGDFLDAPVQTYSTGMRARLGYSVAAHLRPDVLLIDEVLAVGDLAFRRKCMRHIQEYLADGGSLLFVSHDLFSVQNVCSRVIVLQRGRVIYDGGVLEGVKAYFESQHELTPEEEDDLESAALSAQLEGGPINEEAMRIAAMVGGEREPVGPAAEQELALLSPAAIDHDSDGLRVNQAVGGSENGDSHRPAALDAASLPAAPLSNGSKQIWIAADPAELEEEWRSEILPADEAPEKHRHEAPRLAEALAATKAAPGTAKALGSSDLTRKNADDPIAIESVEVLPVDGDEVKTGKAALVVLRYRSDREISPVRWGFSFCTPDLLVHIASGIFGFSGEPIRVKKGRGEFRALVRRLPLHAGKYAMKAGIADGYTGSPYANIGWEDSPHYFSVRSDSTRQNVVHEIMGDLVTLDVVEDADSAEKEPCSESLVPSCEPC